MSCDHVTEHAIDLSMFDGADLLEEKYERDDRLLGHGAHSLVYKGRKLINNQVVALKKVEFYNNVPESVESVKHEVSLLQQLDHKNVLKLLDLCRDTNAPHEGEKHGEVVYGYHIRAVYLVLDYCKYSLYNVLCLEHKLEAGHIKTIMKEVLTGLEYLHSKGIIHRDLKPSNVLIKSNGRLVLADLGFACKLSETAGHPVQGTPSYMPYEANRATAQPHIYNCKLDIWSAGCILYQLFTNRALFNSTNGLYEYRPWKQMSLPVDGDYLQKVKAELEKALGTLSRPKEDIELITGMLQIDPQDRLTARAALALPYFTAEPRAQELGPLLEEVEQRLKMLA